MSSSYEFWKPAALGTTVEATRPSAPLTSPLTQQRMQLPIYRHKKQILYSLEKFHVVVIVGETGCGKSTQLPQYCCEGGWTNNDFSIICTQPRSIAAKTIAQRVEQECLSLISVSWSIPFENYVQQQQSCASIQYVTDEVLVRIVMKDPLLSNYSVVIVDDAHERSIHTDLVLGLLKKIRRKRSSLRVICCSATLDAEALIDFLVGSSSSGVNSRDSHATIISVDGRQHAVDVLYRSSPVSNYLQSTIDTVAHIVQRDDPGDVLCFLPTLQAVEHAIQLAEDVFPHSTADLLPLHDNLPYSAQVRVFKKIDPKKRIIIFATSMAESSITVPDIRHVVDCGLTTLHYFDPSTGLERWITTAVSQATAVQRAGRAGRVQSGKCYRLYTEQTFTTLIPQTHPEIMRSNLTSLVLTLKALSVDNILSFDLISIPPVEGLQFALETLYAMGTMDKLTHLTSLGRQLSSLPTEPRIAMMLLKSLELECSCDVLSVSAALIVLSGDGSSTSTSSSCLWLGPRASLSGSRNHQRYLDYQASLSEFMDRTGDHLTYVNLLADFEQKRWNADECRERFLNYSAIQRCREIRLTLASYLRNVGTRTSMLSPAVIDVNQRAVAVLKCVTAGFFFNTARLGSDGRYYTLRRSTPVTPSSNSILSLNTHFAISHYILFGDSIDGERGDIELRSVSTIQASWLLELAPHYWE